jgi:hypothetical protein
MVTWDSGNVHTGERNRERKQAVAYKLVKGIEGAMAGKTEKGIKKMSGRKKENKKTVEFQIS